MSDARKALLGAVVAVALLAAGGVAHASTIRFSPAGNVTFGSLGRVTFTGGEAVVACNLSLSGTLSGEAKEAVAGTQLGSISSASSSNCEGEATMADLFPEGTTRAITYGSALGTLPNSATGLVLLIPREWLFETLLFRCLYQGTLRLLFPLTATRTAGVYTVGLATASAELTLSNAALNGILCSILGSFSGRFAISPGQTVTIT